MELLKFDSSKTDQTDSKAREMMSKEAYFGKLKKFSPDLTAEEMGLIEEAWSLVENLSKKKQIHSSNVSLNVASVDHEAGVIIGALLHDLKERSPDVFQINRERFSEESINLVEYLSDEDQEMPESDSKEPINAPLAHLQEFVPTLEIHEKNRVILIKICDRLDNLQKRLSKGKISKKYARKSEELFKYLVSQYTPDHQFDEKAFSKVFQNLSQLIGCRNYFEDIRFAEAA